MQSPTGTHYSLLFVAIAHYSLLSVINAHYSLLSAVVAHYSLLSAVVAHYSLLSAVVAHYSLPPFSCCTLALHPLSGCMFPAEGSLLSVVVAHYWLTSLDVHNRKLDTGSHSRTKHSHPGTSHCTLHTGVAAQNTMQDTHCRLVTHKNQRPPAPHTTVWKYQPSTTGSVKLKQCTVHNCENLLSYITAQSEASCCCTPHNRSFPQAIQNHQLVKWLLHITQIL